MGMHGLGAPLLPIPKFSLYFASANASLNMINNARVERVYRNPWKSTPLARKTRHAHAACRRAQVPQASYNKQGEESLRVDGRVTKLWKVFFKPASGYTDRLGLAIPIGDSLDEVRTRRSS